MPRRLMAALAGPRRRLAGLLTVPTVLALLTLVALSPAHPLPAARSCPVFPQSNPWNQRVDRLPVARDSAPLIASIGLGTPVHPDFGTVYAGAPNGIPFAVVGNRTRWASVRFQYADESDHGPYPLPHGVPIEGGPHATGDR